MPRRERDSVLARALLDAQLRYDPQIGALRGLRHERALQYGRTRRVNSSNAQGIAAAVDEAQPDVAAAFDQALASVNAQRDALGVGPEDPQAAAYERRVGEAKGHALRELVMERQRAISGQVYANQAARSEYLADRRKIDDQLRGLISESGAYAVSRRGELADQSANRALTARGQTLSSRDRLAALAETRRANRARERTAQQRADQASSQRPKVKWATPQQHAAVRAQIERASQYVRDLSSGGMKSRAKIIVTLSQGAPKDGEDPAIPAFPPDVVRMATNLVFDKSLSRTDLKNLHNAGLQLRRLGYEVRPPQPRGPRRSTAQALIQGGASGGVR